MKIIEKTIVGKHSPESCEDCIALSTHFIAVIDGSTSKTPFQLSPLMKNGRMAAQLIARYIETTLPPDATLEQFCTGATAVLRQEYEQRGLTHRMLHHPEERLTASAIVYSRQRREVWMVGDCQAIVGGRLYDNPKPYEQTIATKRAELIRQGTNPQQARKQIEPELIEAMLTGQNRQYAVIDGFPIHRPGVKIIQCQPSDSPEIILASDGYPFLCPTLSESEEALARQLRHDPQNITTFIATKGLVNGNQSFDDRAYIRFLTE